MPRINRVAVEFSIPSEPGKVWLAEFTHRHASQTCPHTPKHERCFCPHFDGKGRPRHPRLSDCTHSKVVMTCPWPDLHPVMYEAAVGKMIPVLHITSVKLRHKGERTFLSGIAPCSLNEEKGYNWRKGIHLALQRALARGGFCKLEKLQHCPHPAKGYSAVVEGDDQSCLHGAAECPSIGHVSVVEKTRTYTEVMEAFWRESRIKAQATKASGGSGAVVTSGPVPMTMALAPSTYPYGLGARGDY